MNEDVHFVGPPKEVGPLPAVIYFTMSREDSLHTNPYNQPLAPLSGQPIRAFSWDLPFHPNGTNPRDGLEAWKKALERGEDFLSPFIDHSLNLLNYLIKEKWTKPGSIFTMGLSRGAVAALHLAARSDAIKGTLAFAPLVDLAALHLSDLATSLSPLYLFPYLYKKIIRLFVSYEDSLVSTDKVIQLAQNLSGEAKKHRLYGTDLGLVQYPPIGHKGHGTPQRVFEEGGYYLLKNLI